MGQTPYRTDSLLDMAEVTIIYLVKMEWMKERHEEEKICGGVPPSASTTTPLASSSALSVQDQHG